MADFKNTYEQKKWEFAANQYSRMKMLVHNSSEYLRRYANIVINELEQTYPCLKDKHNG